MTDMTISIHRKQFRADGATWEVVQQVGFKTCTCTRIAGSGESPRDFDRATVIRLLTEQGAL